MSYDHQSLEQKWQKYWEENQTFKTNTDKIKGNIVPETKNHSNGGVSSLVVPSSTKPKKYILDMFPYPSGAGLHVGHPKGYTATDIVSRYYHAKGFNVLHPMGFDAFGLPAENYAIKTGTHPAITTAENIATFTEQMKNLGFSYDWDRTFDTTDPEYYHWTQWIFLELFKRGLAYEQDLPINYCPSCKTGLANEEVLSDNTCDRCGTRVEKRRIRQWVLAITKYAERLLSDIDDLDWPEGIKEMQRNWIGKSEGCEFRMFKKIENKPTALILHGWEEEGQPINRHWQSWLKSELEKVGYNVIMPDLPGYDHPDLDVQLAFLDQYKDTMNEDSLIIGHSMGGFLAMHFVERLAKKIGKLICVAPIFDGLRNLAESMPSWDFAKTENQKAGWNATSRGYDLLKVVNNIDSLKVFLSENDPWIPSGEAKKHFDMIGIDAMMVPNAGHFCERDGYLRFDMLLEYIVPHISVYTTRVDTVYGMTYAVLAPDHPKVGEFITPEEGESCQAYIEGVRGKSDQDRTNDGKEKTGVFTGSYVINPYNDEAVPLWIGDFVLGNYGTGALMAVPAHDERDFIFAKKYNIPLKISIAEKLGETLNNSVPRTGVGALIMNDIGEILLQSQTYPRGAMFSLPGGGVEEGEDYREALVREIQEETGYTDLLIEECIGAFEYNYFSPERGINRKLTEFTYRVVLKSHDKQELELTDRELKLDLQNVWTEKNEVSKKLIQTKDFCGFPEERILNRYFEKKAYCEDGILVNSGEFSGLTSAEARGILTDKAASEGFGQKKVNYKLRDWLFSRQRYWGEPIPLIHISLEDYAKLPRIEKIEDAREGEASIVSSGGTKDLPEKRADSSQARNDKSVAQSDRTTEFLVIDGKIFSQVYDGLNSKIIIDSSLPLTLPEVERYEPAGDGQSPLANVPEWVNVKLADNLEGKRETNTMPQWGGSCWYYLRYMDNKNAKALASEEAMEYWQNVDEYVGGAEHAVLHLLYARFWHKVLYDAGIVPTIEPFQKLTNVGMILAYAYEREDGGLVAVDLVEEKEGRFYEKETAKEVSQIVAKMSKSLKNVVNPNDIVREYGADTLRLYEMSMSGFTDSAPWNPDAIVGVRRFLDRIYVTFTEKKNRAKDDMKAMKLLHKTIKKVGEDIVDYKFNTAISALMILLNEGVPADEEFATEWKEKFAIMLHPFAPHMAEELWSQLSGSSNQGSEGIPAHNPDLQTANCKLQMEKSIYSAPWPDYDEWMLIDDEVTIAIQVNGKLRGTLTCLNGVMQDEVSSFAHSDPNIAKWVEGKILVKEIFIPNKMLSIVVKDQE